MSWLKVRIQWLAIPKRHVRTPYRHSKKLPQASYRDEEATIFKDQEPL
jgi:hypothetical protein